jgi:hypothetical protein
MGMVNEPVPTDKSSGWGIWRWKREWNGSLERIEIFRKFILPQYRHLLRARNIVKVVSNRFQ